MGRFDALTQIDEAPEKKAPVVDTPSPMAPEKEAPEARHEARQEKKPENPHAGKPVNKTTSPRTDKAQDTSLLTTKEKTKYATYLTDQSIQKISIRAIQIGRDAHQIVQEAVNQYFERLEK